jgi:DNA anti-recombination protein RmuC
MHFRKTVTMMLEDKIARETEKRVQEEERNQLQAEISRLTDALEQEKKRGFWSRLFPLRFRVTIPVTNIRYRKV